MQFKLFTDVGHDWVYSFKTSAKENKLDSYCQILPHVSNYIT